MEHVYLVKTPNGISAFTSFMNAKSSVLTEILHQLAQLEEDDNVSKLDIIRLNIERNILREEISKGYPYFQPIKYKASGCYIRQIPLIIGE